MQIIDKNICSHFIFFVTMVIDLHSVSYFLFTNMYWKHAFFYSFPFLFSSIQFITYRYCFFLNLALNIMSNSLLECVCMVLNLYLISLVLYQLIYLLFFVSFCVCCFTLFTGAISIPRSCS